MRSRPGRTAIDVFALSGRPISLVAQALVLWLRRLPTHLINGLNAALGLLAVTLFADALGGFQWALGMSVGAWMTSMPDLPAQPERKVRALLPSVVGGTALYGASLALHPHPDAMPVLLAVASFLAVLPQAWGKRGVPLSSSLMLSLVLPMAVPMLPTAALVLQRMALFFAGGVAYMAWTRASAVLLDTRYRTLAVAACVDTLATLLRLHATDLRTPRGNGNAEIAPSVALGGGQAPQSGVLGALSRKCGYATFRHPPGGRAPQSGVLGALMTQQAAWADQLQAARDLVFNRQRTARQRHLAAALLALIDVRDLLLTCQLDLGVLRSADGGTAAVQRFADRFNAVGATLAHTAVVLRRGGVATPLRAEGQADEPPRWRALRALRRSRSDAETLAGELRDQLHSAGADAALPTSQIEGLVRRRMDALAGQAAQLDRIVAAPPTDAVVPLGEAELRLFVSPDRWRWAHLRERLRWRSPVVRYALRTMLAMLTAYGIALALPWAGHRHWILITVAVVLRSSYAQTADRTRWRLWGTAFGCLVAAALLKVSSDTALLFGAVVVAAGLSHGYATVRYAVTAGAASVLGLVQTHLLSPGGHFLVAERLADTLIGLAIAWAFSFVLPVWERQQIPDLIKRLLQSQARSAELTLRRYALVSAETATDGAPATDADPAVDWRLARREVNDALAALIAGVQRMRSEPRQVQLPMPTVAALLAHSQELTAHMISIAALLVLRRQHLDAARIADPLRHTAAVLKQVLSGDGHDPGSAAPQAAADTPSALLPGGLTLLPPDGDDDRTPWLLRRLQLAEAEAERLVAAARPLLQLTQR